MNKATGRFNLRARKSMKLLGQKECNSCSRYYFPREYSDDEENIDSSNESEQICCNCEQKKQAKMKPTKKIHQNVASPKTIKIENVDPNEMDHNGPIQNKHNQNRGNNFRSDCMVQIHFDELTMQPTAMLDSNAPEQVHIKPEILECITPTEANQSAKPLRNKTNTIQSNRKTEIQPNQEPNCRNTVQSPTEQMITMNDTTASLHQKFPNATPYEFEFLLFLRSTSR